jgi:hypothetical protein
VFDAKCSSPESLPACLHRRGTDCEVKSAEQLVISETSDQTRSKAVHEEVKFDVRVLVLTLLVFAVNNLGFRRMHLQVALRQPGLKLGLEGFCFLLGTAVCQPIVSIPTPREIRVRPRHPEVATGMRVNEALGLDRPDVDLKLGILRIQRRKFGKSRYAD